jgi:Glycosyltransferase family 87
MKKTESLKSFKLLLVALVAFSFLCNLKILWAQRSYIAKGYFDFVIYYSGAEIVNAGRATELYDLNVQQAYQDKFKFPNQPWSVLPFNHAPYELLLFLPLAHLPYQSAHIVWSVLNVLLLVVVYKILAPFLDGNHRIFFGALLLAFYPTAIAIKMGQDSIISLLILSGCYANLKRHREILAGSILALGLYKPHLVLPLAGILTISGYWRVTLGFIGTGVVLSAISLAMVGWQGVVGLFSIVAAMDRPTSIVYPESMTNLRGLSFLLLSLLNANPLTNIANVVASLIVCGCCLWLWKNKTTENSSLFDLRFSLAVVTTVLVSFHLYTHDVIILLIPLLLIFSYILLGVARVPTARYVFLGGLILLNLPLVPYFLEVNGGFGWGVFAIILLYLALASEIYSFGEVNSQRPAPENLQLRRLLGKLFLSHWRRYKERVQPL